jgi:hypothetical protein
MLNLHSATLLDATGTLESEGESTLAFYKSFIGWVWRGW